jgi:hypothetical protein
MEIRPLSPSDVAELQGEIARAVGEALIREQAQRKQINDLHEALSKEVAARRSAQAAADAATNSVLKSIDTGSMALNLNDNLMKEIERLRADLAAATERIRQLTSTP